MKLRGKLKLLDMEKTDKQAENITILNIETSGDLCAVAIGDKNEILCKEELYVPNIHSEKLAELVEICLTNFKLHRSQINAVAVSSGPGSFTGLRIGMSFAKGFAFAKNIPIIGISTLKILALSAKILNKNIDNAIVLIDARRNEFYWSSYIWENGRIKEKEKPQINSLEQIVLKSDDIREFVILKTVKTSLIISEKEINGNTTLVYPNIEAMHFEALNEYGKSENFSLDDLEPLYLRAFAGII